MDDTLRKIFKESEKAELLESIISELETSDRVVVCFEKIDSGQGSDFRYLQLGFRQSYEVYGFLEFIKDMILSAESEEG